MSSDENSIPSIQRLTQMPCAQCATLLDVSAYEPFAGIQCPSCGNQDVVPARFGAFLLLNLINTGGMGQVFRARDESLGRLVAIKVMLRNLGDDAEFVENFRREAQAAARLNHPNVAQIYSYGQAGGQPYIVMELVSGHRCDKMIDSHPDGLDPALVMRIGLQIAEGLAAGNEIGLVHGDIKPENILLDEKRTAKLVDFGIASYADQAASKGIWGTPYYIAPERARGLKSDLRSDIYSLGATLYHALTGKPPFEGATPIDVVKARLVSDPQPIEEVRPAIPKGLAATVMRMLQREPVERHPTYASLIGDLRRTLQETANATVSSGLAKVAGKRVIVKRKGGIRLSTGGAGAAAPAAAEPPPDPAVAREQERLRRRRRVKILSAILGSLVAVVAAGAITFTVRAKRAEEREARRLAHELKLARTRVAATGAELRLMATNVLRSVEQYGALGVRARAITAKLEALAAEPPAEPAREPPPQLPVLFLGPGPAPRAKAQPPPTPAPAAAPATNAVAAPPPAAAPAEAAPTNAPVPAAATTRVAPEAASPPAAPAPEPDLSQDRIALARRVNEYIEAATAAAARVPGLTKTVNRLVAAATKATTLADVERTEPELALQRNELLALTEALRGGQEKVYTMIGQLEVLARARQTAVDAHKQSADAARREREQQERLDREQADLKALETAAEALAVQLDYGGALAAAKAFAPQSDAGRKAAARLIDRYTYLVNLRQFLVDSLNTTPFPWGWIRPGTAGEDILGATATGVKLRGGREVSWADMSRAQFLKIVEFCVNNPKVRRTAQGRHLLATAIYCELHGNLELRTRYRDQALTAAPSLLDDAERIMTPR